MRRNLPFNSLRAFEATARHLNFTRAAEELCISQGAVSRHVGNLEKYLRVALFKRTTRSLQLTDAGEILLGGSTAAFDALESAVDHICGGRGELNLQVALSFAVLWLIPRLADYESRFGHSLLRMTTRSGDASQEFDSANFDAGILYGNGQWPELHVDLLRAEQLVPVCSPVIKDAVTDVINGASDSPNITLLHSSPDHRDWRRWLTHCPNTGIDANTGIAFETMGDAVNAALAGHGVTVGDLSLLDEKLRAGQLVRIFSDDALESGQGYYLACRQQALQSSKVENFRRWVLTY